MELVDNYFEIQHKKLVGTSVHHMIERLYCFNIILHLQRLINHSEYFYDHLLTI